MNDNIIVEIHPEDITSNDNFLSTRKCPLALACSRTLNEPCDVGTKTVYMLHTNKRFFLKESFGYREYKQLKERYENNSTTKDFYTVELIPE